MGIYTDITSAKNAVKENIFNNLDGNNETYFSTEDMPNWHYYIKEVETEV